MSLFHPGQFRSHSGHPLEFKIQCDCLTESDLDLFAKLIATKLYKDWEFNRVVGVPKGQPGGRDNGDLLAQYVRRHVKLVEPLTFTQTLIVDDVLTTGKSMEAARFQNVGASCVGAVIFARGPCPDWVKPLFTLNKACW